MIDKEKRLDAFADLGELVSRLSTDQKATLFGKVQNQNNWFTPEQTEFALTGISNLLSREKLSLWVSEYHFPNPFQPLKIGIIMAGNLPGVGFHDLLCVLVSGHNAHIKLSSSDQILIPWLVDQLITLCPEFKNVTHFEERLQGMDAYIATGSDNSARYFDYYFGKYPHIIRKNRTSIAVIDGNETSEDWQALGKDIFLYYGLGCRNVSKVFFSDSSQISDFLEGMGPQHQVMDHHKYLNNYDYNKSIYLINQEAHFDNGHLLLKESKDLVSPISVIYYEVYEGVENLEKQLLEVEGKIQCMVSRDGWFPESIPFGQAQCPEVGDYADKVDTLKFLLHLGK